MGQRGWKVHAWALVATCMLGVSARVSSAAPADAVRAEWEADQRAAVARLHDLADWCRQRKLYACRAAAYELVLRLDPDDAKARKGLHYERGDAGEWVKNRHAPTPRNHTRHAARYEERQEAWATWFAEAAFARYEQACAAADPALAEAILACALSAVPDAPAFRHANDEVLRGGRWLLKETAPSIVRRTRLRRAARSAVRDTPEPTAGRPVDIDDREGVKWDHVFVGSLFRVVGRGDEDELRRMHVHVSASGPVFEAVLGTSSSAWTRARMAASGMTLYVFPEDRVGERFYAAQKGVSATDVSRAPYYIGLPLPKRLACLVKGADAPRRLEAALRQVIWRLLWWTFRPEGDRGWPKASIEDYLVLAETGACLLGTKSSDEGRYDRKGNALPEGGIDVPEGDDWLRSAQSQIERGGKPSLHLLAGKHLNDLDAADRLYGYAVVAYLVEAHPQRCAAVLRDLLTSPEVDLDFVFSRTLGWSTAQFERRLARWLDETLQGS